MTLQDRINEALVKRAKDREGRERSGKFGASSFGKCLRAQVLNRANVPVSDPLEIDTLHMFEAGHLMHDYVQQYYPAVDCEVKVGDDNFIGFADIVESDAVLDIKSTNPAYFFFGWKDKKKVEYNVQEINELIPKKKVSNILQVTDYALRLSKPVIKLVFVSRDLSYGIRAHEWTGLTANWRDRVEEERAMLMIEWNKYKEGCALPEKLPRLYDGKECSYCGWRTFCKTN